MTVHTFTVEHGVTTDGHYRRRYRCTCGHVGDWQMHAYWNNTADSDWSVYAYGYQHLTDTHTAPEVPDGQMEFTNTEGEG